MRVERFGWSVNDEVFRVIFSGESWAWGDSGGGGVGVCSGCDSSGVDIESLEGKICCDSAEFEFE